MMKFIVQDEPVAEAKMKSSKEWTFNVLKQPEDGNQVICVGDHLQMPIAKHEVLSSLEQFAYSPETDDVAVEQVKAIIRHLTRSPEAEEEFLASQGLYKEVPGAKEVQWLKGMAILIVLSLANRPTRLSKYHADKLGYVLSQKGVSERSLREFVSAAQSKVSAEQDIANITAYMHFAKMWLLDAIKSNSDAESSFSALNASGKDFLLASALENLSYQEMEGIYMCYSAGIKISISRTA